MLKKTYKYAAVVLIILIYSVTIFSGCGSGDSPGTITGGYETFSFAAVGDNRGTDNGLNSTILKAVMTDLSNRRNNTKYLLYLGDLVAGSKVPEETLTQLQYFKEVINVVYENDITFMPTIGNHEVITKQGEIDFLTAFPDLPQNGPDSNKGYTYSFDYQGVHFVSVKTDRYIEDDPDDPAKTKSHYVSDLDWLEADLKKAVSNHARFIFVFGHQPAFPNSTHIVDSLPNAGWIKNHPDDPDADYYLKERDRFWALLAKYNVSAYLCGHDHVYGRQSKNGVYHILAGGAGSPLYNLNPGPGEEGYNEKLPYYKILNHPQDENGEYLSQASTDFVGGRYFHYSMFKVEGETVTVETYGSNPKEGTNNELPDNYSFDLKDSFTISQ